MLTGFIEMVQKWLEAISVCAVIKAYQEGVVFRLGKKHRVIGPGLHWLIPLVDECDRDVVVSRTLNLQDQSLTTKDGKSITVSAVVTARIRSIEKAVCEVENFDTALCDACYGSIGAMVVETDWADIRAPEFRDALKKACQQRAGEFGAWIERINFDNLVECPSMRVFGVSGPQKEGQ